MCQLQQCLRLCPASEVLDMLLWFAEASKDRGLLGGCQADFLLVYG